MLERRAILGIRANTALAKSSSYSKMFATCFFGTTSVCPGVTWEISKERKLLRHLHTQYVLEFLY